MAEKLGIGATKFDAKEKMEYAKRYFHQRCNYRISLQEKANPILWVTYCLILLLILQFSLFTYSSREKYYRVDSSSYHWRISKLSFRQ
jgi:hypothetical protein